MTDAAARLAEHQAQLAAFVRREAGPLLLRFESVSDLVQGVHEAVLRAPGEFEWRGEDAFVGWLHQVARRHLSGRRDHWLALKRRPARLLRLSMDGADGRTFSRDLALSATGPATFAGRREILVAVTRAMDLMLPRDRDLLAWWLDGVPIAEIAARLGATKEAARRARSRALERLRKTILVLTS